MKYMVIGMQRVGTNFATKLLQGGLKKGSDDEVIVSGDKRFFWKHALPHETVDEYSEFYPSAKEALKDNPDINLVLLSKHPLWWLSSVVNRKTGDLKGTRAYIYDDGVLNVESALTLYFDFYRNWFQIKDEVDFCYFRYTDVLKDTDWFIRTVNDHFDARISEGVDADSLYVRHSKGQYSDHYKRYLESDDLGLDASVMDVYESFVQREENATTLKAMGYEKYLN